MTKERNTRAKAVSLEQLLANLKPDHGWADDLRSWLPAVEEPLRDRWRALLVDTAQYRFSPFTPWRNSDLGRWRFWSDDRDEAAVAQFELVSNCWPTKEWRETMARHIETLGPDRVAAHLCRWFRKVPDSDPSTLIDQSTNREVMRGLLMICPSVANDELVDAIRQATSFLCRIQSSLDGVAACSLHGIPSMAGLSALSALARELSGDFPRSRALKWLSIFLAEEIGADPVVPESIDASAGNATSVTFRSPPVAEGKDSSSGLTAFPSAPAADRVRSSGGPTPFPSPPAAGGESQGEGGTDILLELTARLKSSWLQDKKRKLAFWREQWIDHPIAGALGRSLIWQFEAGNRKLTGLWRDGELIDLDDQVLHIPADASATLWHPLHAATEEVLDWRRRVDAQGISQPFKQAYREVYVVAGVERRTKSYSERFAAHILRLSQFKEMASARGWDVSEINDDFRSRRALAFKKIAHFKLFAGLWLKLTGPRSQTYLCSDQVRFHKYERVWEGQLGWGDKSARVPLDSVPSVVFSEIMREVNALATTTGVGRNPQWSSVGLRDDDRYLWCECPPVDESANADSRREKLEAMLPTLGLNDRCTLVGHHLIVRGSIRTYKIHLGTGDVFTDPCDRHLCIMPRQQLADRDSDATPIEGDHLLATIVDRARALADDIHIADEAILSQLTELI
jgi:hypothetical protein